MSKRFDNKRILYVLAGLTLILVLTILVKIPGEKSTLKDKLFELDTMSVNKIIFYPKTGEGTQFEFLRRTGNWIIQKDNIVAIPEKDAVKNILMEVRNIKPISLEAVDRSKWKEFNLTDSLATRIKLLDDKGKCLADLMIGRFTYSQQGNPYANPNANNIQGISFVRLYDENKVYGVDGFISLSLSGRFNDYRDKSFIKFNMEDASKISFVLPSDSSFVLSKKDSVWYAGGDIADSLAVAGYLNELRFLECHDFKDNFKPGNDPDCQLLIEGNNLLNLSVKCYKGDQDNEFILNSNLNPDVYFSSKKDGIFDKLFKSQKYFLTKSVKTEKHSSGR